MPCKSRRPDCQWRQALDKCICVHAEENAILSAARHGRAHRGCTIYATAKPCLGCLRQIIQIQAESVLYQNDYLMDAGIQKAFDRLKREQSIDSEIR